MLVVHVRRKVDDCLTVPCLSDFVVSISEAASSSNREARARRKANEEQKQREQDEARKASNMRLAERLAAKRAAREAEAAELQEEEARVAKQRMFLGYVRRLRAAGMCIDVVPPLLQYHSIIVS